jgi:hypothetical protein
MDNIQLVGIACRNMRAVQEEALPSIIDLEKAAFRWFSDASIASIEIEDEDGKHIETISMRQTLH